MAAEQDVSAARAAVGALQQAVAALRRQHPDSVDARRLELDVSRVAEDLDLLAGPEPAAEPRQLEVIEEREYPPEFFAGAESEGIGPR